MTETTPESDSPPEPVRVAVLDEDGRCVNVVLIDPGSDWTPGDRHTTHPLLETDPVGPGHVLAAGTWVPPQTDPAPDPDAPPSPGTLADLQAQVDRLTDLVLGAR